MLTEIRFTILRTCSLIEKGRLFRLPFAVLSGLAILLAGASHAAEAARPNIVVFLVDDMGVMDTSVPFLTDSDGQPVVYPLNEYYQTPAMQRLASQGIRFNQFYAMSVCSPTRVSIMTGQNAARHRTTNWINPKSDNAGTNGAPDWNWAGLKSSDITLPGILQSQGYKTIHVGKAHFGPEEHEGAEPLNLGFDINIAGAAFGAPGSYYGQKDYGKGTPRQHHAVPHLEKYHGTDTFLTEALTLEANRVLSEVVEQDQPFYLYFAQYAVHGPFDSDPRFAEHYADSDKPKSAQAFATLIEGMDKSLGDVLDHLDALGVAEDTLVLFLGDNGSDAPLGHQHAVACAAPLRGKKGAHYEGGMRVPFIAAWAKQSADNAFQKNLVIPRGVIQSQVASVEDLFPTILELTGCQAPADYVVDGKPLQTLLTGGRDATRGEEFLMHYPHGPHRSNYFTVWRNGRWKAIYHALPDTKTTGGHIQFGDGHFELFDLQTDPFESHNVAANEPDVLKRMMAEMIQQLEDCDAVYPLADGKRVKPQLPN